MKIGMNGLLLFIGAAAMGVTVMAGPKIAEASECVHVYYDRSGGADYQLGETYAILLQNLLGHFPQFQQIVSPIERYQAGEIEQCRATFYIGSYFDNAIPEAFLSDFSKTRKSVAWLGYSIWKLGNDRLSKLFGYRYVRETVLDYSHLDAKKRPGFYRDILYKGEKFFKYGEFDSDGKFQSSYEIAELEKVPDTTYSSARILAEAVHSVSGRKLPYAIQKENRYYIADNPFTYIHEADRYLVFADLLFDILGVEPTFKKKPAVFRLEDLNTSVDYGEVKRVADILDREGVPIQAAVIPIYADPLNANGDNIGDRQIPIDEDPGFRDLIANLVHRRATLIWHGVTHQYGRQKNPNSGASADDYEFWDSSRDSPIQEDSIDYVLQRLERGWKAFARAGFKPQIWETPHYQASSLDYEVFSRVFSWNIGRAVYAPTTITGLPAQPAASIWFENSGGEGPEARRSYFDSVRIDSQVQSMTGQLFPYEIYGDYYGQRLLPEDLGNPENCSGVSDCNTRTIQELIDAAKRDRVLRDVWSSFFYHPFLIDSTKMLKHPRVSHFSAKDIRRLIRAVKSYGYEFISLDEFIRNRKGIMRPDPIYLR
jgi:uncharacterized protein YdaL